MFIVTRSYLLPYTTRSFSYRRNSTCPSITKEVANEGSMVIKSRVTAMKMKISQYLFVPSSSTSRASTAESVYTRGTNVQNADYQRCEHPGFPGASSVCNVLVPWTYPSPTRGTGVHCGTAKGPLGLGV
eukprot:1181804-Prorocentrum_minimum.AAC.1